MVKYGRVWHLLLKSGFINLKRITNAHGEVSHHSGCARDSKSMNPSLMVHLPSNDDEIFYETFVLNKKIIEMLEQVFGMQDPFTPKSLMVNIHLLFGLSQVSTKDMSR